MVEGPVRNTAGHRVLCMFCLAEVTVKRSQGVLMVEGPVQHTAGYCVLCMFCLAEVTVKRSQGGLMVEGPVQNTAGYCVLCMFCLAEVTVKRKRGRELNVAKSTVRKVLKKRLTFNSYRPSILHGLKPDDNLKRSYIEQFKQRMRAAIESEILIKVWEEFLLPDGRKEKPVSPSSRKEGEIGDLFQVANSRMFGVCRNCPALISRMFSASPPTHSLSLSLSATCDHPIQMTHEEFVWALSHRSLTQRSSIESRLDKLIKALLVANTIAIILLRSPIGLSATDLSQRYRQEEWSCICPISYLMHFAGPQGDSVSVTGTF
ncbi:hypothetical protein J6590_093807 [Homalodisca vitripennis]|nr:hypothetical protein J6590_093807 [Homalodisca vitripennis]